MEKFNVLLFLVYRGLRTEHTKNTSLFRVPEQGSLRYPIECRLSMLVERIKRPPSAMTVTPNFYQYVWWLLLLQRCASVAVELSGAIRILIHCKPFLS
jgi:hypothetical protein